MESYRTVVVQTDKTEGTRTIVIQTGQTGKWTRENRIGKVVLTNPSFRSVTESSQNKQPARFTQTPKQKLKTHRGTMTATTEITQSKRTKRMIELFGDDDEIKLTEGVKRARRWLEKKKKGTELI
ncbi:hypothetical protein KPH14_006426 [Odynerus spinipes]|uniref:Uncharacterized protein n=1 Tax=Odynerus spinipes TaxID=1348599 RepID=A0AAD9RQD3_9HYME|nr:hypothetical protein KPH14_006426 [Odynerus spinipes]